MYKINDNMKFIYSASELVWFISYIITEMYSFYIM